MVVGVTKPISSNDLSNELLRLSCWNEFISIGYWKAVRSYNNKTARQILTVGRSQIWSECLLLYGDVSNTGIIIFFQVVNCFVDKVKGTPRQSVIIYPQIINIAAHSLDVTYVY